MTTYILSRPRMVDPYLSFVSPNDDLSLILHGFGPEQNELLDRYPGHIDYRSLNKMNFKPSDVIISTVHINSKNYVALRAKLSVSGCRWVHCAHDYAEPVISFGKDLPIHKGILLNKPQYKNTRMKNKLYINPHSTMSIPSCSSELYERETGRALTKEERQKNIFFNITKHPNKPLIKQLVDRAIKLSESGYRIFVKGYGYDEVPDHYKSILGLSNVFYPTEGFGPTGAPLLHDWCNIVLGTKCSASVEALYYNNLPFIVDNNEKRESPTSISYYKTVGQWCPFISDSKLEYLANNPREAQVDIKALKRFWLGVKLPTVERIRRFIYE